ncbi:replication-relaxation family protein [Streptomyces sp. NPDC102278]|uniref:replication-relaxation family protein n=1 Tax=Streptomyces sp. NPDC102278 TaxID=3366152 RepID=UPI003807B7F9
MPASSEYGVEHDLRILQLLACTRVATPHQLHTWLTPIATDSSTIRKHLRGLAKDGLVAANEKRRPHIWFLTDAGLSEARRAGLAEHRTTTVTGEHVAASPAFAHALAVTDTAIAFSRNLQPDTEYGTALGEVGDWEVEVAHPLGAGGLLVPDAVLHLPYSNLPHAFLELDRATMSLGKLINKVAAYDRYRHYAHRPTGPSPARASGAAPAGLPHWYTRYPRAAAQTKFPPLLIVLADKKKTTLDNRTADTLAGIRTLRGIHRRELAVGITTLPTLQEHGPLNPIWHSATNDKPQRLAALINGRREHGGG